MGNFNEAVAALRARVRAQMLKVISGERTLGEAAASCDMLPCEFVGLHAAIVAEEGFGRASVGYVVQAEGSEDAEVRSARHLSA